jgi:hypothetical protein
MVPPVSSKISYMSVFIFRQEVSYMVWTVTVLIDNMF